MDEFKIIIDPSHGGNDFGVANKGIREKDYVLNISKYMKERFDELGIESSMTRTTDETISPADRIKRINNFYGDERNVIILCNTIGADSADGLEIIYALRNKDTLPKLIANEIVKVGKSVKKVHQLRSTIDPAKDYYSIHRETGIKTQPLLLVYEFMDNKEEDVNQLTVESKKTIEAIISAIAKYINVSYKSPKIEDDGEYYTIQKGDTLYNIARRFNLTVEALKGLNNLKSNLISIGQKLKIAISPNRAFKEIEKTSLDDIQHIVSKGDNLYSIADKYGTNIDTIKELNNLSTDILSINQVLLVPMNPNFIVYLVKPGDKIYDIALEYGTTIDEILKMNELDSVDISVNQKLILPKKR